MKKLALLLIVFAIFILGACQPQPVIVVTATPAPATATALPSATPIVVIVTATPIPTLPPATVVVPATSEPTPTPELNFNPHTECLQQYPKTWERDCRINIDVAFNGDVTTQVFGSTSVDIPTFWNYYREMNPIPAQSDNTSIKLDVKWTQSFSSYMLTNTIDTYKNTCYLIKLSTYNSLWYTERSLAWKPNILVGRLYINRGNTNQVFNAQDPKLPDGLKDGLSAPSQMFNFGHTYTWAVMSDKDYPTLYFDTGISITFGVFASPSYINIRDVVVVVAPTSQYCNTPDSYIRY